MDIASTRVWRAETNERPRIEEEGNYKYFYYRLARPVICTINFRSFITQGRLTVKVVPVKCGEGCKFTQEGVIRVPVDFDPFRSSHFNKVKARYTPASLADYEEALSSVRIKVYFRGFPLQTLPDEINYYFSQLGKIEYLYLMGPTKSKDTHRSVQGYVIYSSNQVANDVLSRARELFFRGLKIFCEVYQTRKKRNLNSHTKSKDFVDNNKTSRLNNPVKGPGSAHGQSIKDRLSKHRVSSESNPQELNSFVSQKQQGYSSAPVQGSASRPYLKFIHLVKSNSSDQDNLRFNILCKGTLRSPNMVIQ